MSTAEQPKACTLSDRKGCTPCTELDQTSILTPSDLQARVSGELPLWKISPLTSDPSSTPTISRTFTARNFQSAMEALNVVGARCEALGHHADLHLESYREVRVVFYTHKVGGVTGSDGEF